VSIVVAATASNGIELTIVISQIKMVEHVAKKAFHVFECGDKGFTLIKMLVLPIFSALSKHFPSGNRKLVTKKTLGSRSCSGLMRSLLVMAAIIPARTHSYFYDPFLL